MQLPSVDDVIKFVDATKNVAVALLVLFMGFYITLRPDVAPEYAGQWIGASMTVVGVYVGARTVKGRVQQQ
jgi:hypothetical protein